MATLLYEVPSGIAIFSFDDGACLHNPAKDFWARMPRLSLKELVQNETVPCPIDIANNAIDDHLAKRLAELCGSENKLVVGSAEYKRIVEMNLGITCLYVDVADCEVIICSQMNPVRTLLGFPIGDMTIMLLYEAPSGIAIFSFDGDYLNDPAKDFWECLPPLSLQEFIRNETLPSPIDIANNAIDVHLAKRLTELCGYGKKLVVGSAQYKAIIEMNLVNDSIIKEARRLHQIELREKEHLKFLRLLLKDFMMKSGIDTENWILIQFATALRMICYPGASYRVYRPDKIFLSGEYAKMKAHASGYDIIFSKIDVLFVYEDVIALNSEKYFLLSKLDVFVKKAAEDWKKANAVRLRKDHASGTDLCTAS